MQNGIDAFNASVGNVISGKDGQDGKNGQNGKDGQSGNNGVTPTIGNNGNWWIGDTDTGQSASDTNTNGTPLKDISVGTQISCYPSVNLIGQHHTHSVTIAHMKRRYILVPCL
jgi:hypothetical protein